MILYKNMTLKEAKKMEIRLIKEKHTFIHDVKNNGYNMTKGGEGTKGHRLNEVQRKKMSDARKGKTGSLCPNSYRVFCDNIIYDSITDFCIKNNLSRGKVEKWLNGKNRIPLFWLNKDLRLVDKEDKRQRESQIKEYRTSLIYCNVVYKSQKELASFLEISPSLLTNWLKGKKGVPKEVYKNGIYDCSYNKYPLILSKKIMKN